MKIVVTGANGFVGKRFMEYNQGKFQLQALSLRSNQLSSFDFAVVDAIVHLAGKAHDMRSTNDQEYFNINFELTKKLADKAKAQGVPHFLYISSVKVYGDEDRELLDEESTCIPGDAYGKSKLEAEKYLKSIENNQFKVAIVRPPLVYGPGVKGNMNRMLKLANSNLPLPFAKTRNRRSMVFLDNLIELLNRIVLTGSRGTFVAGDERAVSTEELISEIRKAMDKKTRLFAIPGAGRWLLRKLRPDFSKRLFSSFVIENKRTNQVLQFAPPFSFEFGIKQTVDWYQSLSEAPQKGSIPNGRMSNAKS
jgi:nucleoside-diphosphate-sugar epimerase